MLGWFKTFQFFPNFWSSVKPKLGQIVFKMMVRSWNYSKKDEVRQIYGMLFPIMVLPGLKREDISSFFIWVHETLIQDNLSQWIPLLMDSYQKIALKDPYSKLGEEIFKPVIKKLFSVELPQDHDIYKIDFVKTYLQNNTSDIIEHANIHNVSRYISYVPVGTSGNLVMLQNIINNKVSVTDWREYNISVTLQKIVPLFVKFIPTQVEIDKLDFSGFIAPLQAIFDRCSREPRSIAYIHMFLFQVPQYTKILSDYRSHFIEKAVESLLTQSRETNKKEEVVFGSAGSSSSSEDIPDSDVLEEDPEGDIQRRGKAESDWLAFIKKPFAKFLGCVQETDNWTLLFDHMGEREKKFSSSLGNAVLYSDLMTLTTNALLPTDFPQMITKLRRNIPRTFESILCLNVLSRICQEMINHYYHHQKGTLFDMVVESKQILELGAKIKGTIEKETFPEAYVAKGTQFFSECDKIKLFFQERAQLGMSSFPC